MKKIIVAALVLASLIVNERTNAQQGSWGRVGTIPLSGILQNEYESDSYSIKYKAPSNVNFGIWAGYNLTPASGLGTNQLYFRSAQYFSARRIVTHQRIGAKKNYVYPTYIDSSCISVSSIGLNYSRLSVLTDSILTYDCDTLKSKPDVRCVRKQRP